MVIKKAYGYVTRVKEEQKQVLVFKHSNPDAGIQIPKGTVKPNKDTYSAVIQEIKEETGLENFSVENDFTREFQSENKGTPEEGFYENI